MSEACSASSPSLLMLNVSLALQRSSACHDHSYSAKKMHVQTGAPAASSTNKPCSWQHQHAHCAASLQIRCLRAAGRAARIRAQAAAADAAVTTMRPADIQPVQCLKEWAPVCAALGDGLQTVRVSYEVQLLVSRRGVAGTKHVP
jgi:hypothetical protein